MECEMERRVKCTFDSECSQRKYLSGPDQRESFTALQLGLPVQLAWKAAHTIWYKFFFFQFALKTQNPLVLSILKAMLKPTNTQTAHLFSSIWLWLSESFSFQAFCALITISGPCAANGYLWPGSSRGREENIARARNNTGARHNGLT